MKKFFISAMLVSSSLFAQGGRSHGTDFDVDIEQNGNVVVCTTSNARRAIVDKDQVRIFTASGYNFKTFEASEVKVELNYVGDSGKFEGTGKITDLASKDEFSLKGCSLD